MSGARGAAVGTHGGGGNAPQQQPSIVFSGWLEKRSRFGRVHVQWKNRYCVLSSDRIFSYYETSAFEHKNAALESIDLRRVTNVGTGTMRPGGLKPHRLEVVAPKAFWCFAAKTQEVRDEWIAQLQHISGARSILTPAKEGMLMEEGKTLKTWRWRYFAMFGTLLLYFKNQDDCKAFRRHAGASDSSLNEALGSARVLGILNLEQAMVGKMIAGCGSQKFVMHVMLPERKYHFAAETEDEVVSWVDAIEHQVAAKLDGSAHREAELLNMPFPTIDLDASMAAKANGGGGNVAVAGEHLRRNGGTGGRPPLLSSPSMMLPSRPGTSAAAYGRQHPKTPPALSSQTQRAPAPFRRQASSPAQAGFPGNEQRTGPVRRRSLRRMSGKGDSLTHRRMDFGIMTKPTPGRPGRPVSGATSSHTQDFDDYENDSSMSPLVTGAVQYAQQRADRAPHVRSKYFRPSTDGPAPDDVDPFAEENEADTPVQHAKLPYGRLMPLSPSMQKTTTSSQSPAVTSPSSASSPRAVNDVASPRAQRSPPARRRPQANGAPPRPARPRRAIAAPPGPPLPPPSSPTGAAPSPTSPKRVAVADQQPLPPGGPATGGAAGGSAPAHRTAPHPPSRSNQRPHFGQRGFQPHADAVAAALKLRSSATPPPRPQKPTRSPLSPTASSVPQEPKPAPARQAAPDPRAQRPQKPGAPPARPQKPTIPTRPGVQRRPPSAAVSPRGPTPQSPPVSPKNPYSTDKEEPAKPQQPSSLPRRPNRPQKPHAPPKRQPPAPAVPEAVHSEDGTSERVSKEGEGAVSGQKRPSIPRTASVPMTELAGILTGRSALRSPTREGEQAAAADGEEGASGDDFSEEENGEGAHVDEAASPAASEIGDVSVDRDGRTRSPAFMNESSASIPNSPYQHSRDTGTPLPHSPYSAPANANPTPPPAALDSHASAAPVPRRQPSNSRQQVRRPPGPPSGANPVKPARAPAKRQSVPAPPRRAPLVSPSAIFPSRRPARPKLAPAVRRGSSGASNEKNASLVSSDHLPESELPTRTRMPRPSLTSIPPDRLGGIDSTRPEGESMSPRSQARKKAAALRPAATAAPPRPNAPPPPRSAGHGRTGSSTPSPPPPKRHTPTPSTGDAPPPSPPSAPPPGRSTAPGGGHDPPRLMVSPAYTSAPGQAPTVKLRPRLPFEILADIRGHRPSQARRPTLPAQLQADIVRAKPRNAPPPPMYRPKPRLPPALQADIKRVKLSERPLKPRQAMARTAQTLYPPSQARKTSPPSNKSDTDTPPLAWAGISVLDEDAKEGGEDAAAASAEGTRAARLISDTPLPPPSAGSDFIDAGAYDSIPFQKPEKVSAGGGSGGKGAIPSYSALSLGESAPNSSSSSSQKPKRGSYSQAQKPKPGEFSSALLAEVANQQHQMHHHGHGHGGHQRQPSLPPPPPPEGEHSAPIVPGFPVHHHPPPSSTGNAPPPAGTRPHSHARTATGLGLKKRNSSSFARPPSLPRSSTSSTDPFDENFDPSLVPKHRSSTLRRSNAPAPVPEDVDPFDDNFDPQTRTTTPSQVRSQTPPTMHTQMSSPSSLQRRRGNSRRMSNRRTSAAAAAASAAYAQCTADRVLLTAHEPLPEHEVTRTSAASNSLCSTGSSSSLPQQQSAPPSASLSAMSAKATAANAKSVPALPAELQTDIRSFKFHQYAGENLRGMQVKSSFIFRRKRANLDELLNYQATPITSSLLQLKSRSPEAVQNFKAVMDFMGRDPKGNRFLLDKVAQRVVRNGAEMPQLRDEIFFQIAKQVTGNPDDQSTAMGWRLMTICASAWAPSVSFDAALRDLFLKHALSSPLPTVKLLAGYCDWAVGNAMEGVKRGHQEPLRFEQVETLLTQKTDPTSVCFNSSLAFQMHCARLRDKSAVIPPVLKTLTKAVIKLGGEKTSGIFRTAATISDVKSARETLINETKKTKIPTPEVAADLLKQWLRHLSVPLIPPKLYDEAIKCSDRAPTDCVALLREKLGTDGFATLEYLMKFLAKLAEHKPATNMDAHNFAIVFQPNLMRPDTDDMSVMLNTAHQANFFLEKVMRHYVSEQKKSGSGSGSGGSSAETKEGAAAGGDSSSSSSSSSPISSAPGAPLSSAGQSAASSSSSSSSSVVAPKRTKRGSGVRQNIFV